MINFIIAILADTYSKYMKSSLGLYYDGVIQRIPLYEDDSRYGGLIIGSPPFNIAAIVLVPFYCCIKDERRLISINEKFNKAIYAPIALISAILFAAINMLLMPLAYIVAMFTKITLLRSLSMKKKQSFVKPSKKSKKIKEKVLGNPSKSADAVCKDLIVFILFGLPFLLGAQVVDLYYFITSIYREDVESYESQSLGSKPDFIMNEEQFKLLEKFLKDELARQTEQEALEGREITDLVDVKTLVLRLRKRLGIANMIHALVFEQDASSLRVINFYN